MGTDLNGKELGPGFFQRKDGRYMARFINRHGNRQTLYSLSLTSLRKQYRHLTGLDAVRQNSRDPNIKVDEFFDTWLYYVRDDLRKTTKKSYAQTYKNYIKNQIGDFAIADVTLMDIQNLSNKIMHLSQSICDDVRVILVDMFDYAVFQEIIPVNFVKKAKFHSKKPKKQVIALTKEEQRIFLDFAKNTKYNNAYKLILNTGLRRSELAGITNQDIDINNKLLFVNKQMIYNDRLPAEDEERFYFSRPKTPESIRVIPLNQTAIACIQNQQETNSHQKYPYHKDFEDLLFRSKNGLPVNASMNDNFYRLLDKIIAVYPDFPKFGLHTLRHTFATRLYEAGVDPKTIQAYLGHKSVLTTMDTYVSSTDDLESLKTIDAIFDDLELFF